MLTPSKSQVRRFLKLLFSSASPIDLFKGSFSPKNILKSDVTLLSGKSLVTTKQPFAKVDIYKRFQEPKGIGKTMEVFVDKQGKISTGVRERYILDINKMQEAQSIPEVAGFQESYIKTSSMKILYELEAPKSPPVKTFNAKEGFKCV